MAVRTAVLAAGTSPAATGTVTLYTCPAGKTAILKDARLSCRTAGAIDVILGLGSGPTLLYLSIVSFTGNGDTRSFSGFMVLEPGDRVWFNQPVANACEFWLSGTELLGVA